MTTVRNDVIEGDPGRRFEECEVNEISIAPVIYITVGPTVAGAAEGAAVSVGEWGMDARGLTVSGTRQLANDTDVFEVPLFPISHPTVVARAAVVLGKDE